MKQAKRLLAAFKQIKVKSPPVDCLSPIGEELIKAGLEKEYRLDFIATTVRPVSVYSGNPFLVEVGLGYGGELEKESRVEILRFANRVPLVYQQGACAITHAVESVSWKNYSLGQPTGSGVPVGPAVLLVHIASTNIPFTSESKDAVADMPEILTEIDLGLKEVARKLRRYLSRQSVLSERQGEGGDHKKDPAPHRQEALRCPGKGGAGYRTGGSQDHGQSSRLPAHGAE